MWEAVYQREAELQRLQNDPVVREYLRFVLSRQGQLIIAGQPKGYFPLSAQDAKAELAKLDEVAAP